MRRVSIIGSGGAGKSTLARRLGDITGLPVIHLDAVHWKPGWSETPKDKWRKIVEALVAGERWVIDGNFGGTMEIRLAASDTVIFLDFPRTLCLSRAVKRLFRYWNRNRPDMGEGCPERLDIEFLHWIWTFPNRAKPQIEARLSALPPRVKVVRLTSPAAADEFLSVVKCTNANGH